MEFSRDRNWRIINFLSFVDRGLKEMYTLHWLRIEGDNDSHRCVIKIQRTARWRPVAATRAQSWLYRSLPRVELTNRSSMIKNISRFLTVLFTPFLEFKYVIQHVLKFLVWVGIYVISLIYEWKNLAIDSFPILHMRRQNVCSFSWLNGRLRRFFQIFSRSQRLLDCYLLFRVD